MPCGEKIICIVGQAEVEKVVVLRLCNFLGSGRLMKVDC